MYTSGVFRNLPDHVGVLFDEVCHVFSGTTNWGHDFASYLQSLWPGRSSLSPFLGSAFTFQYRSLLGWVGIFGWDVQYWKVLLNISIRKALPSDCLGRRGTCSNGI